MDLSRIRHRDDLKNYVGLSREQLDSLLRQPTATVFSQHWIPKRKKGWREVWEVRDTDVADFYKGLARLLDAHFRRTLSGYPHPAAHGYVRGRSTLTNAKRHVGARTILKADLRSFFRNIDNGKVRAVLEQSGIQKTAVDDFLGLLVWDNHAPLGLPTSPILVNAVALDLDRELESLCPGGRYTRYSDDLTFSGPPVPSLEAVAAAVRRRGFELAEEKSHYLARGRGLAVTGLTLEANERPHVPKSMKRRIRQELFFAKKYGLREHAGRSNYGSLEGAANWIHGTVQYIRGIDPRLGERLHAQSCEILSEAGIPIGFTGASVNVTGDVQFLFDESTPNGTTAQVLCLTVVEDEQVVGDALSQLLEDLRAEPGALNIEALDGNGLHWAEIHFDHRTKAVEVLRNIPFRSFYAYRRNQNAGYAKTYEELFSRLIKDRIKKHHGQRIRVLIEENSNLKIARLREILLERFAEVDYHSLRARGDVPAPTLEQFSKNALRTAPLPDLALGVVGDYLNIQKRRHNGKGAPQGAQADQRFHWIEGKVRAVYDLDRNVVFSRRNPLVPWEDQP